MDACTCRGVPPYIPHLKGPVPEATYQPSAHDPSEEIRYYPNTSIEISKAKKPASRPTYSTACRSESEMNLEVRVVFRVISTVRAKTAIPSVDRMRTHTSRIIEGKNSPIESTPVNLRTVAARAPRRVTIGRRRGR